MKKIVGIGACVLDTIINCDNYPTENTKMKAEKVFSVCGGPVLNALIIANKLGVDCSVLSPLSGSGAGERLIAEIEDCGIEFAGEKIADATPFTSYIVTSKVSSSRTCVFDRGTVADDENLIDCKKIDGADILHLDGNYLNCAIKGAKYAKERGILVSLDAGGLYPNIEKLLPYVDILIPSEEFALGLTGEKSAELAMQKLMDKFSPKVIAITQGELGGICYADGKIKAYRPFKVDCVDSNGAGDTFHGAFIAKYLSGSGVFDSATFASAVSAIKCKNMGVKTLELNEEIIKNFMEKY